MYTPYEGGGGGGGGRGTSPPRNRKLTTFVFQN